MRFLLIVALVNTLWLVFLSIVFLRRAPNSGLLLLQNAHESKQNTDMNSLKQYIADQNSAVLGSIENLRGENNVRFDEVTQMLEDIGGDVITSNVSDTFLAAASAATVRVNHGRLVGTGFVTEIRGDKQIMTAGHVAHFGAVGPTVNVSTPVAWALCTVKKSGQNGVKSGPVAADWAVLNCPQTFMEQFTTSLALPMPTPPYKHHDDDAPQRLFVMGYPTHTVDGDLHTNSHLVGTMLHTAKRLSPSATPTPIITATTPVAEGNSGGPVLAPNRRADDGRPLLVGMAQGRLATKDFVQYTEENHGGVYFTHVVSYVIAGGYLAGEV